MLPVSDFNFMVAGIATFAATVGYTYARGKLSTTTRAGSSDHVETKDDAMSAPREKVQASGSEIVEAGPSSTSVTPPTRRESLKRKEPHDGFEQEETKDLGYPHNLAYIYPRKRCRTPSTESDKEQKPVRELTPSTSEDPSNEDWIFVHPINTPNGTVNEPPRTPSPGAETAATPTPATETSDSPLLITTPIPATDDAASEKSTLVMKATQIEREQTPVPLAVEARTIETATPEINPQKPNTATSTSAFAPVSPFQKVSLQKPIGSPFVSPTHAFPASDLKQLAPPGQKTRGFADFAGNKSAFGAFTSSQASPSKSNRPIWTLGNEDSSGTRPESSGEDEPEHAIVQAAPTAKPIANRVTGEENEDVELELKGVKLFVKRGDKPFAEGIVGHLKLLTHRATSEERLLFRREPLWKISMNVRVSPSVRCSYDSTENALRIVTQEPIADDDAAGEKDEKPQLEIVIYAMKPGRSCSKQDFKEFSETLIKNSRLKLPNSA